MTTIGFIGLGAMGMWMARNVAAKTPSSHRIYVYDIVPSLRQEICNFYPGKVFEAFSPQEVAENTEIIITMLPEGEHVRAVYLGSNGVSSAAIGGKLLIDSSTIDTATSIAVRDRMSQLAPSAIFYDAPVSGGVLGAQAGSLAFFLGSAPDSPELARVQDFLSLMGGKIILCGGPTLGLVSKLSNNYLSGLITIACSEAMDMGMRAGVDPRVLARVFGAGTAQNTICDRFCPVPGICPDAPSSKGYKDGFKIQLMLKDFGLAMEMARRVGSKNVLGDVGLRTFQGASQDKACRDLDSRVVFRYLGGNENWRS
ncbi:3-hydroxyisobutyrate dehydrogenase [Penicillium rolfsii]|nr:3-hydroxyisobutyrate dehydrogenase [Penicillium rolfsii]